MSPPIESANNTSNHPVLATADAATADAAATFPPVGFVDRDGAARVLGVSSKTLLTWQRDGRITCGAFHPRPSDGHCIKLYPIDALERLRDEIHQMGKPYPDPERPGVWRVPLKGRLRQREALIDECDLCLVQGRKWNWQDSANKTGGMVILARPQLPLHRLILGLTGKAARAARVSFANGDALDCRRANLLVRTSAEVIHGARPSRMRDGKACASRFKGVAFDSKCSAWRATIRRGELCTTIGEFKDETTAAEAYDDYARLWFGEHAYLNFPHRESSEADRTRARRALGRAEQRRLGREQRCEQLARLLEQCTNDARADVPVSSCETRPAAPMIDSNVARRLLNVPRPMWRRWEKQGYLSFGRRVDARKMYPFARVKQLLEACGRLRPAYPDPQRPNVWRVPLIGRLKKEVLIDAGSISLIEGGWCLINGARAQTGEDAYVSLWSPVTKDYRPLRRLVAGVKDDELQVGHLNDDPLDCRHENLTVTTKAQRCYRKRRIAFINGQPTSSRFKGVSWQKKAKKWTAMISRDGTTRYLGLYANEESAALAYDEAARALFGEHARLNFPDGIDAWLQQSVQRDAA